MVTVIKDDRIQYLINDAQVAAFLASGWALVEETGAQSAAEPLVDEIKALKTEAAALGIKYNHNTGAAKLRKMIDDHKKADPNAG